MRLKKRPTWIVNRQSTIIIRLIKDFQTLNQNFLFDSRDKDLSRLGNVNSIKRDSFSQKFPRDFCQENRRYARPVSRMGSQWNVNNGGWRVAGGLVRIFFFFSRRQTRNESFHQLDGRRGMQLSSLSFRNVRIAARRRAIVFNNYRSLWRGFERIGATIVAE